jgi:hypothetical protein
VMKMSINDAGLNQINIESTSNTGMINAFMYRYVRATHLHPPR